MARDGSGNYSLPAGNPVVSGATISSTWANDTMNDLATEIQDSLSRSGKGGMLVAFKNSDGTVGAPGITWTNETNTGFYRAGSADMRAAVAGADIAQFRTGVSWPMRLYLSSVAAWSNVVHERWDRWAAITMEDVIGDDRLMIYDSTNNVLKAIPYQDFGIRVKASSNQTYADNDAGSLFVMTIAGQHTNTVPPDSTYDFPIGTWIELACQGTGTIVVNEGSGVTVNSLSGNKTVSASGGYARLVKTAANTWHLSGDLEA